MIRGPPLAPAAATVAPAPGSTTMVGDMLDRGRFPGAGKFATEGASPYPFGAPGVLKSSISLLSTTPVDGDVTLDPNAVLTVLVSATAFRSASTTDTCVVPESSSWFHRAPYAEMSSVASSRVIARRRALNSGESMSASAPDTFFPGHSASGSPRFIRIANACLNASTVRCTPSPPERTSGLSNPDMNSITCATAAPPLEVGGIPRMSNPNARETMGAETLGRYRAKSSAVITPPASRTSRANASARGPVRSASAPSVAMARSVRASAGLAHVSPTRRGERRSERRNVAADVA